MNDIPTPETDAALNSGKNWIQEVTDKSRDIEQRLTIALQALANIDGELQRQGFTPGGVLRMMVYKSINATAPKGL